MLGFWFTFSTICAFKRKAQASILTSRTQVNGQFGYGPGPAAAAATDTVNTNVAHSFNKMFVRLKNQWQQEKHQDDGNESAVLAVSLHLKIVTYIRIG